jgi:hypothetical protein
MAPTVGREADDPEVSVVGCGVLVVDRDPRHSYMVVGRHDLRVHRESLIWAAPFCLPHRGDRIEAGDRCVKRSEPIRCVVGEELLE